MGGGLQLDLALYCRGAGVVGQRCLGEQLLGLESRKPGGGVQGIKNSVATFSAVSLCLGSYGE